MKNMINKMKARFYLAVANHCAGKLGAYVVKMEEVGGTVYLIDRHGARHRVGRKQQL